jgi:hypothetical protein
MQKRSFEVEAVSERSPQLEAQLFHPELWKALRRIRKREDLGIDAQVATWFLDFIQRDLNELSSGQWLDLQYEVSCLSHIQWVSFGMWHLACVATGWDGKPDLSESKMEKEFRWLFFKEGENAGEQLSTRLIPLHPTLPSPEVIRALQEKTRAFLEEVWGSPSEKRAVSFEIPALHGRLVVRPESDQTIVLGYAPDPQTVFGCNLVGIVMATAVRLRRCRECNRWFYADRSNKFYCETRCQSRAGTRRNPPKHKKQEKLGNREKVEQLKKHQLGTKAGLPKKGGTAKT